MSLNNSNKYKVYNVDNVRLEPLISERKQKGL